VAARLRRGGLALRAWRRPARASSSRSSGRWHGLGTPASWCAFDSEAMRRAMVASACGPGLASGQALHRALEQRRLGRRRQAFEVVGDELHQGRERDGVALGQAELGAGPGPEVGDVAGVGARRRRRRPLDEDGADPLGSRLGEQDRRGRGGRCRENRLADRASGPLARDLGRGRT
jgi:hypothetical protein